MANLGWRLLDIRTDARLLLQERQGTEERYFDIDLDRWVNEGEQFVASVTRCLRSSATAASVTAQENYSPPASAIAAWTVVRVDYDSVPLAELPYEKRLSGMPDGKSATTSGTPAVWSPLGQEIILTPGPAVTGIIKYWFAYLPDIMAASGTTVSIPIMYGPALVWYVVWKGHYVKSQYDLALKAWQQFVGMLSMLERKEMPDLAPEASRGT